MPLSDDGQLLNPAGDPTEEFLYGGTHCLPEGYFALGGINDDDAVSYPHHLLSRVRRLQTLLPLVKSRSSYIPAELSRCDCSCTCGQCLKAHITTPIPEGPKGY